MKTNYLILFLIFTHPVLSSSIKEIVKQRDQLITDISEIELVKDKLANNKLQLIISYIESNRYQHYYDIDYEVTYNDTVPESDESIDPELLEHINNIKDKMYKLSNMLGKAFVSKNLSKLYFKRRVLKYIKFIILIGCSFILTSSFLFTVGIHSFSNIFIGPLKCFTHAYKIFLGFLIGLLVDTLGRFLFLYNSVKTYL